MKKLLLIALLPLSLLAAEPQKELSEKEQALISASAAAQELASGECIDDDECYIAFMRYAKFIFEMGMIYGGEDE